MLSEADRKRAADILMAAQKERKQAVQLHVTFPDITIEDSYAISTEVMQRKTRAGAKLIGHKVGLTSKAMQRSSMIDEPDYGYILDDQLIADGAKVKHADYCKPRVEVELAFIMGRKLQGPGVGLTDVLRATEYVVPAIEIVDARIQDPRKIVDTVADNGAAAGIALGVLAAFALTHLMNSLLVGVAPTDAATFAAVAALFFTVAVAACLVPARRAAALEPTAALREE